MEPIRAAFPGPAAGALQAGSIAPWTQASRGWGGKQPPWGRPHDASVQPVPDRLERLQPSASGKPCWRAASGQLLLWQPVLREHGCTGLDLGGTNGTTPGVAQFKAGMGGKPFRLVRGCV